MNFCPPKTNLSLNLYKKIFNGWIENTLPVWRGCHCIDKDQCMHQTIFLGDIMLVLTASTKIRKQKSKFLPSIIRNMCFFFSFSFLVLFCYKPKFLCLSKWHLVLYGVNHKISSRHLIQKNPNTNHIDFLVWLSSYTKYRLIIKILNYQKFVKLMSYTLY